MIHSFVHCVFFQLLHGAVGMKVSKSHPKEVMLYVFFVVRPWKEEALRKN